MDAIINFFKSIGDTIYSCIELVWSFIQDIIQIIMMLSKFLREIPGFLSWLPDPLPFLVFSVITIAVIYKIAGREG